MPDSTTPTRILIVEPQPLLRAGIRAVLESNAGLQVTAQTDSQSKAMELVNRQAIDLVITEIRLSAGDGISLIEQLRASHPDTRTVVLTSRDEWLYCERALQAGARGFLGKSCEPESILDGIQEILADKIVVSDRIQQCLYSRLSGGNAGSSQTSGVNQLSTRELQVFEMIGSGLSTRQIADQLELSIKTIDTYREKLKQKLQLENSARLNRLAFEWSFSHA